MSESNIRSDDDLQKARKAMVSRSTPIGCAIIAIMTIAMVFAAVLPFNIPASKVPIPLNWFWNTYGLIFLFGMAGIGLLRVILILTKTMRHAPVEHAITSYDAAVAEYGKWQNKGSKESLLKAHELLPVAGLILSELEEYVRLKSDVDADYNRVFESNK